MREIMHQRNAAVCAKCPIYSEHCRMGRLGADYAAPSAVVFVFDSPGPHEKEWDSSLEGSKARLALQALMDRLQSRHKIRIDYHAVWAVAAPEAFEMSTVKKEAYQHCSPYLRAQLRRIAADTQAEATSQDMIPQLVLVPFGKGAMTALEVKSAKQKDARGRELTTTIDDIVWQVVPTLSLRQLVFQPGSADQIAADLRRAAAIAFRNFTPARVSELTKDYIFPQTIEEVEELVTMIENYSGDDRTCELWPIATDLEATGLKEYSPSARILMASFAWEAGKAAAIPLFHRETPYDADLAFEIVKRLWAGPKPKILHHGKFDVKYGNKFGLALNNWYLDSMYLKHASNEDASGFYDLKSLTVETALAYAGYEDQMKREMAKHGADLLVDRDELFQSNRYVLAEPLQDLRKFGEQMSESSVTSKDLLATPYPEVIGDKAWKDWRRSQAIKDLRTESREQKARWKKDKTPPTRQASEAQEAAVRHWTAYVQEVAARIDALEADEELYVSDTITVSLTPKNDPSRDEITERRSKLWAKIKKVYTSLGMLPPNSAKIGKMPTRDDGTGLFEIVPLTTLATYAAIDADVTFQSGRELLRGIAVSEGKARMAAVLKTMKDLYIPGATTLAKLESVGLLIDRKKTIRYIDEISEMMNHSLNELAVITCSAQFSPSKNAEVINALVNIFHVPYEDMPKTENGNISVNKELLSSLRRDNAGRPLGDFCHHVLKWRNGHKAVNTYLAGFMRLSAIDGRVHTQLHLHRTVTCRLASSEPNLQNVPTYLCACKYVTAEGVVLDQHPGWPIKDLMLPDPGYAIVNLDIKQAEVRVLCMYLAEINPNAPLILAVRAGNDVPSYLTAKITVFAEEIWGMMDRGIPYDPDYWEQVYDYVEIHKDGNSRIKFLRTATKRVLYGALYGAGLAKLAEQIFGQLPLDKAERQKCIDFATSVRDLLYDENPELAVYIERTKQKAVAQKYVDTVFGRRRHFPYASSTRRSRYNADAEREAVNFLIQSPASDLVLSQLVEVTENEAEIEAKVVLTVHDSMVMMVPIRRLLHLRGFLRKWIAERIVERFPWLPVEYAYDVEIGPTYGRMISLDDVEGDPSRLNEKKLKIYQELGLPADFFKQCEQRNQEAA